MKITRERKIFAGVLVLALGWFGYDHFTAAADSPSGDAGAVLLASQSSNKLLLNADADDVSLAERLASLAQKSGPTAPEKLRDVFRAPESWVQQAVSGNGGGERPAPDRFVQAHRVGTVSVNGSGDAVAMVDGRMLRLGAMLDGYKLVSITRQVVIFDAGNGVQAKLAVGR